jgi:hypothetical protein
MNLNIGQISLMDMLGALERKEIIINRNYQRGSDIWPISARSYFIDTILQNYPFPKIYLYQSFNNETRRPFKELVDGQQRITTISDFYNNKFALASTSKQYNGMHYRDLDEDTKRVFLSYQIEHSTILSATRAELLEMFRRMNAYTAPLKEAEKRHSTYQGAFKWFIAEMAEAFSPYLEAYDVLTEKQIARMGDAEFISELIVVLEMGIQSKRSSHIEKLYKDYDFEFPAYSQYAKIISEFFDSLTFELQPMMGTFLTKSYVVHSLFCAYVAIKYGFPGSESIVHEHSVSRKIDFADALPRLLRLAEAHEDGEEDGPFKAYVQACSSGTTLQAQRRIRSGILAAALLG